MQNYSQIECHVEPSRSFCFVFNSHSCLLSRLTGSRRKSCVLATYVVLSKIYYHNYRMRKVNSFWICHHIIHVVCGKDKILNASCVTCTIIFSRHWNTNGVQIELSPSYTGVHSNVKCMAFFLSFNSPIEIPQRKIKIQQRRLFFIFQRYVPIGDTSYHNWDE